MKKKTEGMGDFKLDANQRQKKRQAKRKTEDLNGFQERAKESKDKHEAKKRSEDMKKYKADENQRQIIRQMKRKAEDPDKFRENAKKHQKKYEHIMRTRDITGFKENIKDRKRKSDNNIGADQRICRFRNKVLYGPIFLCSCCHQKLFINQVDEITEKLKEEIDLIDKDLWKECIEEEFLVDLGRNGDQDIECSYI